MGPTKNLVHSILVKDIQVCGVNFIFFRRFNFSVQVLGLIGASVWFKFGYLDPKAKMHAYLQVYILSDFICLVAFLFISSSSFFIFLNVRNACEFSFRLQKK